MEKEEVLDDLYYKKRRNRYVLEDTEDQIRRNDKTTEEVFSFSSVCLNFFDELWIRYEQNSIRYEAEENLSEFKYFHHRFEEDLMDEKEEWAKKKNELLEEETQICHEINKMECE